MKVLIKKYLTHHVSSSFMVIGLLAIIQALNSVVLGRVLSKESFGLFSFLFTAIVPLVTSIVILGQNTSVVRHFSKLDYMRYDWKKYFVRCCVFFAVAILAIVLCISIYYDLGYFNYFYLCLAIFSGVFLRFAASFYRSQKRFVKSILLERASPPLFIIFIGLSFIGNAQTIVNLTVLKTFSYAIPFVVILLLFAKKPCGNLQVNKNIYFDGLLLWVIGLTLIAIDRLDNFFIAKILDYKAVALYAIVVVFMQVYDFAAQAIWSVYSQRFSSNNKITARNFLIKIAVTAIVISSFYIFLGKPVLHLLFDGKYDSGFMLLVPFCIIGCLKLTYVYPSCYFVGRSDKNLLKIFMHLNIAGVVMKIILLVVGIKLYGLIGAAASSILIWCYRNVVGYTLLIHANKRT